MGSKRDFIHTSLPGMFVGSLGEEGIKIDNMEEEQIMHKNQGAVRIILILTLTHVELDPAPWELLLKSVRFLLSIRYSLLTLRIAIFKEMAIKSCTTVHLRSDEVCTFPFWDAKKQFGHNQQNQNAFQSRVNEMSLVFLCYSYTLHMIQNDQYFPFAQQSQYQH